MTTTEAEESTTVAVSTEAEAPTEVEASDIGGFPSRAAAYVLDLTIVTIIGTVSTLLTSLTIHAVFDTDRAAQFEALVLAIVVTGVSLAYNVFFWTMVGSTPGMWLFGLHVTTMDGQRIGFVRAVVRFVAYGVSALFFGLGYIWVIFDRRHQAWHDKIARTLVPYTSRMRR
jgi:uncharacterized RDD family membrane protein YckC